MDLLYLKKVLAGDTEAFSYFIRNYQNMAYAIARSMVKQDAEAQDIVQESFIQAYHHLSSYKQEAKFSSWLYRIVVNKALQTLAKRKKQVNSLEDEHHELEEIRIDNEALKGLQIEARRQLIQSVMLQMPPKEALVLQLFYLQEYRMKEIEEITGFTLNHVKVLLHRGRKHFYHLAVAQNKALIFKDLI